MAELRVYSPDLQGAVERVFAECIDALGWAYEPDGRHHDILEIEEVYMKTGCFWCLFEGADLIGMVAVREIESTPKTAEIKRLYLLPARQGNGYGGLLFDTALDYARRSGFQKVCLDTRRDRSATQHMAQKYGFHAIPQYNENAFAELFFELDL